MKAENVTKDPEFVAVRRALVWSQYYDAAFDAEQHCTTRNIRAMKRALRAAHRAQDAFEAMATARGYELGTMGRRVPSS